MALSPQPLHSHTFASTAAAHLAQTHDLPHFAKLQRLAWTGSGVCLRAAKAGSGRGAALRQRVWATRDEAEACFGSDKEDDGVRGQVEQADWRAFRARLVLGDKASGAKAEQEAWAHALVEPEAGCMLLAHPHAFGIRQHYFHRAVIFLFAHSEEGSAGLILNRPTEYTLGQLGGFEDMMPELATCPLYLGGDVGANHTHVIHGVPGLQDTREIISGVYMGGSPSIKESVQSGASRASDYRWFLRYAGWDRGQLEREVAAGTWYLASCSKYFILKQCIKLPKPLWREIMECMGDPYAEMSRRAYGE